MFPSKSIKAARALVVRRVVNHVRNILPGVVVELYGSEKNGLAFARSDIDFIIRPRCPSSGPLASGRRIRKVPPVPLTQLERCLAVLQKPGGEDPFYDNINIFYARYKLLSFRDTISGLKVQLVKAPDPSNSEAKIASYLEEYSYLRPLYAVVKAMFDVRQLSDVYLGGFGSYPIFMMIVASLKHNPPKIPTPAHGLLSFLEFWSTFDTSKGLSIEPPVLFDKEAEPVRPQQAPEAIEVRQLTVQPLDYRG
jgi:non-canonical poly(A) RNA polymerase PAPD5/7